MRALVLRARSGRGPATQYGVAAIALLAVLVMGSLYGVLVAMNTATAELQRKRDEATVLALQRAKEALIAYAITYSDTLPGEVIGYLASAQAISFLGQNSDGAAFGRFVSKRG